MRRRRRAGEDRAPQVDLRSESRPCDRGAVNRGPAWTALRADERSKRAPACGGEVVGLRLVEKVNDRLALLEETGHCLATRQREQAEVDLAPEPASAPEVAIGEDSGHGQRQGKESCPHRAEETP